MIFRSLTEKDARLIASVKNVFSDVWSEQTLISSFLTGRFSGVIAEENGATFGFITYTAVVPEADIESVFVYPDKRKRGIGGALIDGAIKRLKEKGVNKVFLEVRKSNLPAINLYLKKGFAQISVRKKYYGNEDAVVMVKEI